GRAPRGGAGAPRGGRAAPARPRVPLPPTRPEAPAAPARGVPPTRQFPPYPWGTGGGGGADPHDAPTVIAASPTGAWPAWQRPAGAPGPGSAREADPPSPSTGSRRLHVHPVARAARRPPLDLLAMDPYDFEQLVADLLTKMGYTTQRTGRSGDGGVDVEVRSDDPLASGLIVISVKRLKRTVGAHYVRELAGTVHDRGAIKGILVTTSSFGPSSVQFAAKNRLELVDGSRLRAWLAQYLRLDTV
ncbi:restriction endonuclease, partial [Frankia sp. CNm7]|uniref:restriction endonuclease n=1 Tax=Frankia nepalensis TaxID=1836974 RepID=UPI0019312FC4